MATRDVKLRLLIETVDRASRGVKTITASVDGLSGALKKAEQISGRLAVIGASLTAAFVFPVKAAADFEKSMSAVRAVTEGATEAFEELNQVASELGGRTEFTAKQVADGMRFLGQAGFDAIQVIAAMPDVIDLATAGQLDLASAADIASNVLQGMQLEVSELNRVMDTLAVTATSSNTNVRQLGEALKFAAPASAIAGISIEKTAAIIGILGNNGIQASLAGTALRGMLASLANPSKQAQEALDRLGVTVSRGVDGSLDLIETLRDLGDANIKIGDTFEIFRRRGASAALALANQIEKVDELVIKNEEGSGALKTMADIMRDNLSTSITILISAFNRLLRSLGAPLLSSLKAAAIGLSKFVDALASAASKVPNLTKPLLIAVGALGLFLTAIAGVLISLKVLIPLFGLLQVAIVANPVIAAATAMILFTVAIRGYFSAGETAVEITKDLNREATELADSFENSINRVNDAKDALNNYAKGTKESFAAQEKLAKITITLADDLEKQIEAIKKAKESGEELTETELAIAEAAEELDIQIDKLNGGFFDGGKAAAKFNFALKIDALTKYRAEIIETAKEISKIAKIHNISVKLEDLPAANVAKLRATMTALVKKLESIGEIDLSKPSVLFAKLTEEMGFGVAETQAFNEAFFKLSQTFDDVEKSKPSIESLSVAFERQKLVIGQTADEVDRLQKIIDESNKATLADKLRLQDAQKLEKDAIKETRIRLQALFDFRVAAEEKIGEELIAIQKRNLARGIINKEEESRRILVIEENTQREIARIRGKAFIRALLTFDSESKAFTAFQNQKEQAGKRFVTALETSNDAIEKSNNELFTKTQKDAEKDAEKRIKLSDSLKNKQLRNLNALKDAFSSTFIGIGNIVESAVNKQKKLIDSLTKKVGDAGRIIVDIQKGNTAALLKFDEGLLSSDEKKRRSLIRLRSELERLRVTDVSVGPDAEDTINANRLLKEMIGVRDAFVDATKTSRGLNSVLDRFNIEGINRKISELGGNLESNVSNKLEDERSTLEQMLKLLGDIDVASSIDIEFKNKEEVLAFIKKITGRFKEVGIDISDDKLTALNIKVDRIVEKERILKLKIDENAILTQAENLLNRLKAKWESTVITIPVRIMELPSAAIGKRFGGLIKKLASGGKIPGFGGGDRIQALLEQGEFVIRKEAVSRYGSAFMNAINQMKFGSGFKRFQEGGSVSNSPTTNLNLSFNKSESVQVTAQDDQVRKLVNILRREGLVSI